MQRLATSFNYLSLKNVRKYETINLEQTDKWYKYGV